LRRPSGILTGAIDKLLITKASDGDGFDIEIIDFKTNRLLGARTSGPYLSSGTAGIAGSPSGQPAWGAKLPASRNGITQITTEPFAVAPSLESAQDARGPRAKMRAGRSRSQYAAARQFAFDFSASAPAKEEERTTMSVDAESPSLDEQIRLVASDYQLQMQAYALAVRELMPSLLKNKNRITVTLHFLDPNVEFHLSDELLDPAACERAIDEAMRKILTAREPEQFPVRPAGHCRMCNFLELCYAGREWVKGRKP
jgi:hypothetical protein